MIIVEGCDGTGKSTLIKSLERDLKLPVNPRAVKSSTEGMVDNPLMWAQRDVVGWQHVKTPRIYDRHPMVSELIYGPVIRGMVRTGFSDPEGMRLQQLFSSWAMIILCQPPYSSVAKNVMSEDQMPGVLENIGAIYHLYSVWVPRAFKQVITYNYEQKGAYHSIVAACRLHIGRWTR